MTADEAAQKKKKTGDLLKKNNGLSLGWHIWTYCPSCDY
jgi:hypothetical protein